MAKKIQPWEAEVDNGSATPTPPKNPAPKPKKEATVPVGQSEDDMSIGKKCGGKVKKMARGGGIEIRGKTRGRFV